MNMSEHLSEGQILSWKKKDRGREGKQGRERERESDSPPPNIAALKMLNKFWGLKKDLSGKTDCINSKLLSTKVPNEAPLCYQNNNV